MAENLRLWMEKHGYSPRELGKELGLSKGLIVKCLAGERSITGNFKWRFAQRFGWETAEELFADVDIASDEQKETSADESQPDLVADLIA